MRQWFSVASRAMAIVKMGCPSCRQIHCGVNGDGVAWPCYVHPWIFFSAFDLSGWHLQESTIVLVQWCAIWLAALQLQNAVDGDLYRDVILPGET